MSKTTISRTEEAENFAEKQRIIIRQIEEVETVNSFMGVDPNLVKFERYNTPPPEVTLLQSGTLLVLWFFVLLAHFLLFWQMKKRGGLR